MNEGIGLFIKIFTPLLMINAIRSNIYSYDDINKIENYIIYISLIILSLGVFNLVTDLAYDSPGGRFKWGGKGILVAPYMSPANFSFMLTVPTLLAFTKYLSTKKLFWLLLYFIFLSGVFFAFTRISMLGVLVGTFTSFAIYNKSYILSIVAPILSIILMVIAIINIPAINQRMFFNEIDISKASTSEIIENLNTSGRSYLWKSAFEYFKEMDTYLGNGIGSTDYWLSNHTTTGALHSEFLRIYFDLGKLGLFLFLFVLLEQIFKPLIKFGLKNNSNFLQSKIAWFYGVMSVYILTLLTDNTLNYVTEFGIYAYIPAGIILSQINSKKLII